MSESRRPSIKHEEYSPFRGLGVEEVIVVVVVVLVLVVVVVAVAAV